MCVCPDLLMGDLQAQMAACTACERNMTDLFRRYGREKMTEYFGHLHDYAERLARAEIRDIPDGTYEFTDYIDGLGKKPVPIVLKVKVIVAGDGVTIDWTGSSAQVKGGINSPLPFTKACAYTAMRSIMTADVPNCFGYTRAIKVVAPEGSVMNPDDAVSLRRARHHRLPHDRLPVRRAGEGGAAQSDGRQYGWLDPSDDRRISRTANPTCSARPSWERGAQHRRTTDRRAFRIWARTSRTCRSR